MCINDLIAFYLKTFKTEEKIIKLSSFLDGLPGFYLHLYFVATHLHQHWPVSCFAYSAVVGYLPHTYCSVFFFFSPGEVPDTREALLNAFKRLDNDISLEAQVGTVC